ncbi:motility protein A [Sphingomonas flavalba]|uniref:motility protein A n=1 Tax=Sphingomonas flavalba TaxID=2559804 RepID=UPI0039E1199D
MMNPIPLAAFVDPTALAIVIGGTLAATAARGPLADTLAAFRALPRMFGRPFDTDAARARVVKAERVSRGNLVAVDAELLADPDLAEAIAAIGDGAGPEAVEAMLDAQRSARAARHGIVHEFWAAAAETAPAMGMIGTLFGLVRMFRAMDDPATIGGAMATALLATLYGALIANLVAAPIAARLRRQSARELVARCRLAAPLGALARRQTPRGRAVKAAEPAA